MFKKAIVIGCPGSGKSTFSRRLHEISGISLYHLDMIWHNPDRTTVTAEEFDSRLSEILSRDEWIIDGNYARTLQRRLDASDTVFFLDYPLSVCLSGIEARIGKKRPDMPWVENEFDPDFKKWVTDFPQTVRPGMTELLDVCSKTKSIYIFKTREEADEYLSSITPRV